MFNLTPNLTQNLTPSLTPNLNPNLIPNLTPNLIPNLKPKSPSLTPNQSLKVEIVLLYRVTAPNFELTKLNDHPTFTPCLRMGVTLSGYGGQTWG